MSALVAAQMFERYRINRWLGSGISGETYEAEDTVQLRKVALKLIHPWGILPDAARRQFFREMQDISQLHHPYLAPILDYGESEGKLYVVRRFASTGSLLSNEGRIWFKPPLPINDAFHYAHQLAQALNTLHAQGHPHGSLTLSNILILRGFNADHEPDFAPFLLCDAGLANFARFFGQPQITLLPITAAPEQFSKRVTPASDQFALAVLLYFWLAGHPPYLGSTEEIVEQKLTGRFVPLTSLNHEVTPSQEAILRKALAVSPEERFPSIPAFTGALLAALAEAASVAKIAEITAVMPAEVQPVFEPIPQTDPGPVKEETSTYPAASDHDTAPEAATSESAGNDAGTEPVPADIPHSAIDLDFDAIPDTDPVATLATAEDAAPTVAGESRVEETTPPASLSSRLEISAIDSTEPCEFILEEEEYMLGRAGSDVIFLENSSVSRHHALLRRVDGCYILGDNRSATGVYVNGQKLTDQEARALVDGDQITIGNYALIFRQG